MLNLFFLKTDLEDMLGSARVKRNKEMRYSFRLDRTFHLCFVKM
jgi:hypothetical protein